MDADERGVRPGGVVEWTPMREGSDQEEGVDADERGETRRSGGVDADERVRPGGVEEEWTPVGEGSDQEESRRRSGRR